MFQIFRENKWFYIPYLAFLIIAGAILLIFTKSSIHLYINNFHCTFTDSFFKNITHLGDGITVALFIILCLCIRYRYAIVMVFSTLFITLTIQSFKRYILPDIKRPKLFFNQIYDLYFVPGVDVHTSHSFPSGHTASAFTMFLLVAIMVKNKYIKLLAFFMALLVAYSRIYLSQHFLNDVYFGSLIAVFFTTLFYIWVRRWKNKSLDSSLLTTLRLTKK